MMNVFWDLVVRSLAELAFPVIKDLLQAGIFTHVEELVNKIKEQLEIITNGQSVTARQKAQDAEARANAAKTPEEVARYEAIADVWREVAEGLKKENQELKQTKATVAEELAEHKAKAETWREAYETLQKQNDQLKLEIDRIKLSTTKSVQDSVSSMQMSDVIDTSQPDKMTLKKNNSLLNPSIQDDANL